MQIETSVLEQRLGYVFQNKSFLVRALTHSSYANEQKKDMDSNERQEFLGDSVLSLVVSDFLFHTFHVPEGDLTKLRASIVCESSLYGFACKLKLGECLLLGRGEEQSGGRERPSILADAFEAVLAAVYQDGGLEAARGCMRPFLDQAIKNINSRIHSDYKTILQELVQKSREERLSYVLAEESGPDHNKSFVYHVRLNSNVIGKGRGRSKKAAEQAAAKEALELMGYSWDDGKDD